MSAFSRKKIKNALYDWFTVEGYYSLNRDTTQESVNKLLQFLNNHGLVIIQMEESYKPPSCVSMAGSYLEHNWKYFKNNTRECRTCGVVKRLK